VSDVIAIAICLFLFAYAWDQLVEVFVQMRARRVARKFRGFRRG